MLKNFLLSSFFAVLTAVGGVLAFPLLWVPFSMQTLVVMLSGLLLGNKYGPLSQALYIALGLIGLPVFAGGTGGVHHVFSPTFGFLVGFVACSWTAGTLAPKGKRFSHPRSRYMLACLAASVALYAVGLPLFYLNMNFVTGIGTGLSRVLKLALWPFVIPDLLKALAAALLAHRTVPLLRDAGLLTVKGSEEKSDL